LRHDTLVRRAGKRRRDHASGEPRRFTTIQLLDRNGDLWRCSMSRSLLALFACATLLGLAGCAATPGREQAPPLSPEQIVEMARSGQTTADIITRIQLSDTVYNLTASQFVQLSKDGVADAVLDYMQQTYIKAVERQARREAYSSLWFSYGWYGHPWYSYPGIVYMPGRLRP
jgi:hypothetical protein